MESAITLSSRYLHHHRDTLVDVIDAIGKVFESLIGSSADVRAGTHEISGSSDFLDNLIISNLLKFNPLSWIMEAITEEVGDDKFKIPPLNLHLAGKLFAVLKK